MRSISICALIVAIAGCSQSPPETTSSASEPTQDQARNDQPDEQEEPIGQDLAGEGTVADILDVSMKRIDGTPEPLDKYRGKVVMIVNVASKCGLTPQYDQLEAMYEKYRDDGLVILGFPANDFRGQEPGTNSEILTFCTTEYGVSFPMFEKIVVTGDQADPLFKNLSALSEPPSWNFTKYLIDREGHLVERIDPRTTPDDEQVQAKIQELLGP